MKYIFNPNKQEALTLKDSRISEIKASNVDNPSIKSLTLSGLVNLKSFNFIGTLVELEELTIDWCTLMVSKDLVVLGKLPNLKRLILRDLPGLVTLAPNGNNPFKDLSKLEALKISHTPNLKSVDALMSLPHFTKVTIDREDREMGSYKDGKIERKEHHFDDDITRMDRTDMKVVEPTLGGAKVVITRPKSDLPKVSTATLVDQGFKLKSNSILESFKNIPSKVSLGIARLAP